MSHRRTSMAELVSNPTAGETSLVQDRRRCLPEVVRRDPGEALAPRALRRSRRVFRGSRNPPLASGKTGASSRGFRRNRCCSISMARTGSSSVRTPLPVFVVFCKSPLPVTRITVESNVAVRALKST